MPIRPPSLRSVAAFEAAARLGSFTRAAEELNLTTGAVSHAIRALEDRLAQRLFDRGHRRVRLTPDGARLAGQVRLGLSLLGSAFDVVPWQQRNVLVVSTLPMLAANLILPGMAGLRAALPGFSIDLRCDVIPTGFEGDVDVALRFGPGGWSGVNAAHLADETLFPVASPAYRGGLLPATPADLLACDLILHPNSSWAMWFDGLGVSSAELHCSLRIDDSAVLLDAARQGAGIALARGHMVKADLASGRLVRLFDHAVPAEHGYWAVWRDGRGKQGAIDALVSWARHQFQMNNHHQSDESF